MLVPDAPARRAALWRTTPDRVGTARHLRVRHRAQGCRRRCSGRGGGPQDLGFRPGAGPCRRGRRLAAAGPARPRLAATGGSDDGCGRR